MFTPRGFRLDTGCARKRTFQNAQGAAALSLALCTYFAPWLRGYLYLSYYITYLDLFLFLLPFFC